MKGRLIWFGIAIVIGVAVSIFTVSSGEVGRFNDKLVDLAMNTDSAFTGYVQLLERYISGESVDPTAMAGEQKKLMDVVEKNQKEVVDVGVPDCDLCRQFRAGVTEYLANSHQIVEQYAKINAYAAQHMPASQADVSHVEGLLAALQAEDEALFNQVGQLQKKMADEYDLELE